MAEEQESAGYLENVVCKESDLSEAERPVWIVKIPRFVAESWRFAEDEELLGTVVMQPRADRRNLAAVLDMDLNPDAPCREKAGKHYEEQLAIEKKGSINPRKLEKMMLGKRGRSGAGSAIAMKRAKLVNPSKGSTQFTIMAEHTEDKKLNVFSEDANDDGAIAWEGCVRYRGETQPKVNDKYRALCKSRAERSREKFRSVQFAEGIQKADGLMDNTLLGKEKETVQPRREKLGKDEMEAKIFEAFAQQEFWTLKDLSAHLEQANAWIREVLQRLCVYHKKAPRKNHYELREEYKVATPDKME